MLFLKYLLMTGGIGMILIAVGILTYDLALEVRYRQAMAAGSEKLPALPRMRWRTAMALAMLAWAPILIALSIAGPGHGSLYSSESSTCISGGFR